MAETGIGGRPTQTRDGILNTVTPNSTVIATPGAAARNLSVGPNGTGVLVIQGGGTLADSSGTVGNLPGGLGTVRVTGADSNWSNASVTTWGTVTLDSDYTLYALLHSSQIPDNNFSFYRNEEVDRLLDEARRNVDEAFRLEAYRRVAEIVQEELPIMALDYPLFSYAKNAVVEGEVINYSWINLNLADAVVK